MTQAQAKPSEPRAELIVAAVAECGGHSVKELDELARIVVASPHSPKLPKGMTWIGAGISKSTIGICKVHVLKVCYGTGGWVGPQGLNELAFWRNAAPEVRALLAPIEAADAQGRWILAGRCIPANVYDGESPAMAQQDAISKMARAGLSDLHRNNIGVFVRDGVPYWVCLDYGAGHGNRSKQLVMGQIAGTAIVVNPAHPVDLYHCFTGKVSVAGVLIGKLGAPCTCKRCQGNGGGFHKGMGKGQRKAPLGLTRVCWTGKPAPCGCPRCEGNHKLGRMREPGEDARAHGRPMAPRPPVAVVKAPKARKASQGIAGTPKPLRDARAFLAAREARQNTRQKALAREAVAAHARMLDAQVNPLAPVAPKHVWEIDVNDRPRCHCPEHHLAQCGGCGEILFGLREADCQVCALRARAPRCGCGTGEAGDGCPDNGDDGDYDPASD